MSQSDIEKKTKFETSSCKDGYGSVI